MVPLNGLNGGDVNGRPLDNLKYIPLLNEQTILFFLLLALSISTQEPK